MSISINSAYNFLLYADNSTMMFSDKNPEFYSQTGIR